MADFPQTRSFARDTSAAVHGPAGLQQDIADEIADHLACHAEADATEDPAAAQAAAIKAFGDPQQVARDLRQIHLGDRIMFQRIMIAVLAVVVLAMALTAYLSWSANRETARQFAEMNKNLSSLVEAQRAAATPMKEAPPTPAPAPAPAEKKARIQVFCCTVPGDKPVADKEIEVLLQREGPPQPGGRYQAPKEPFSRKYRTGPDGRFTTEPLREGGYYVGTGSLYPPPGTPAGTIDRSGPEIRGYAAIGADGADQQVRLIVGSELSHEIRVQIPSDLTWDHQAMSSAWLRFYVEAGAEHRPDMTWVSPIYPIHMFDWNKLDGLVPGRAGVCLYLDNMTNPPEDRPTGRSSPGPKEQACIRFDLGEIDLPAQASRVTIPFPVKPYDRAVGLIYNGSRDRPLADAQVEVFVGYGGLSKGTQASFRREVVHTNAEGRFVAFAPTLSYELWPLPGAESFELSTGTPSVSPKFDDPGTKCQSIAIPWHTADGNPATLRWPLVPGYSSPIKQYPIKGGETRYECDLSQVGTLRVTLTGMDKLPSRGTAIREPVGLTLSPKGGSWSTSASISPEQRSLDTLLFPKEFVAKVRLPVVEYPPDAPELERHVVYSNESILSKTIGPGEQRDFIKEVRAGERSDLTIAVDDLKNWTAGKPEWRQRTGSPPTTAPATQPAETR